MSLPLTSSEKEKIADIISILYSDNTIYRNQGRINQQTIFALEKALLAIEKCNHQIKILFAQLIGGSALLANGWLRNTLAKIHREITNEKIRLNGLACKFAGAYNYKSSILMTIEYGL